MTKFQIMSDIHQEFSKAPLIQKENVIGEVLLLAGDITNGPARIDYLKDLEIPIFYVVGNHEYYHASWERALDYYRSYFDMIGAKHIKILEREIVIHNGVRIIGTTLWTDFRAPMKRYIPAGAEGEEFFWEDQAFNCRQGMADFSVIQGLTIEKALDEHNKCLGYIKQVLSTKHDGPTIVMTHHAPSFKSSHPRYDTSYIKAGFCSSLDYVIEEYQPDLWIHGHTHESFDYTIGRTRVVCNPYGYGVENKHNFKDKLIVEL